MSENESLEPVMVRVAKCKKMMDEGKSLRQSCKDAKIDSKVYKRNLPALGKEIDNQNIEIISKPKILLEKVSPTPTKEPVTLKEMLIRIPMDDYDYLVEEKNKTGVAPATNAAKVVREWIRERRSFNFR